MKLRDLVGRHALSGVDFSTRTVDAYGTPEECQCMRFRLDGVVYVATENPDDDYRSSMSELLTDDLPIANAFNPVPVVAFLRTEDAYGQVDDVLELIDEENGAVVLEVGTGDTDDYYPYYVASFNSQDMAVNSPTGEPTQ